MARTLTIGEKTDVLLLGPWTNLARTLAQDPLLVKSIGTIYISGGSVDPPTNTFTSQWPFTSKTKGDSWNTFADPIAVNYVLGRIKECINEFDSSECPALVMISHSAQDMLLLENETQSDQLLDAARTGSLFDHLAGFYKAMSTCNGQTPDQIRYWDQSAAVLAAYGKDG